MIEAVDWQKAVIYENATFQSAFQNLNDVAIKLCICVKSDGRLIGLLTDGDLRRGLLRGSPWMTLYQRSSTGVH